HKAEVAHRDTGAAGHEQGPAQPAAAAAPAGAADPAGGGGVLDGQIVDGDGALIDEEAALQAPAVEGEVPAVDGHVVGAAGDGRQSGAGGQGDVRRDVDGVDAGGGVDGGEGA